jgi:hypothetical protein
MFEPAEIAAGRFSMIPRGTRGLDSGEMLGIRMAASEPLAREHPVDGLTGDLSSRAGDFGTPHCRTKVNHVVQLTKSP